MPVDFLPTDTSTSGVAMSGASREASEAGGRAGAVHKLAEEHFASSSKTEEPTGTNYERMDFGTGDRLDLKGEDSGHALGDKDPLLQARETIGEVHSILKQFGINLDKAEPEPETAEVKDPEWEVNFDHEEFHEEFVEAAPKHHRPLKERLNVLKREHMHLNIFVPKLKLKRSDWISSHSLHMPKLHSPHGHLRLFQRVSARFRKYRHEEADFHGAMPSSYTPEVRLKSALKKHRVRRINSEGELVVEEPTTPRRSPDLAVSFSHVVVIDEEGKEKFYELTPEITAQQFQLRHGVEVKDVARDAVLSHHEHHMSSSERFTGKGFTRESKGNGIFVEAR